MTNLQVTSPSRALSRAGCTGYFHPFRSTQAKRLPLFGLFGLRGKPPRSGFTAWEAKVSDRGGYQSFMGDISDCEGSANRPWRSFHGEAEVVFPVRRVRSEKKRISS